jgi:ketosteroid isomerase-like protein
MNAMDQETEIIEMERQLREAILSGSVQRLEALIADDLLFVNPSGYMLTKAMDLEAHSSGLLKIEKIDLLEQRIRALGEVVVAVSRLALAGTYSGAPFAGDYRYTRVWHRTSQGWQVAAGQCGVMV